MVPQTNPTLRRSSPGERVYEAYLHDGSIDLFAGLGAVFIGLTWILDLAVLTPIAPVLVIPGWILFRRMVVEPRLGHVRFDHSRRARLRRAHVVLFAVGCGALILAVAAWFLIRGDRTARDVLGTLVTALPSVLLGIGAAVSALMFGFARFALYGLAFVLAGLGVVLLELEPGWALFAGGVVTTVAGCMLLIKFMRSFPRLSNELE